MLLFSFVSYLNHIGTKSDTGISIIFLAGIISYFIWYRLIKSYKGMNSGKFKVIHEMEQILGYQPYNREWEKLGRGKDRSLYLPFTNIEIYVPWVFGGLYILFFFQQL